MGKPTGFMEYKRETALDRPPGDRLRDWDEFHGRQPEEAARVQGARCMDCGTPFCHAGIPINGMALGCPLHNLIPEWNELLYRGLWMEALERLLKTNNFPEFTGRVCPAPCEGSCTLGINGPPVTIKGNECGLIDRAYLAGWIQPRLPSARSGKHVAVIGSGPAGLACADQLNKSGHWITVYERADRIGGLLMYGIPNMKLDKSLIKRRADLMRAEGVRFVTGTEVGKDYPVAKLRAQYDAVVLCGGAAKPRDLDVPGQQLHGVHFAMEFLQANTKSLLDSGHRDGMYLSAEGKDVVIIGGGDTGTDCVATALRHGCRSVTQFEIVPHPPDARAPDNPWPQWPRVHKMDYGQEETAALYGCDPRLYCLRTKRLAGDGEGAVKEVHTVRVEWLEGPNGRPAPVEIPGTERVYPAQMVLLALGFLGPEDALPKEIGVARDARTNVWTNPGGYATSIPGVFAAGDMRRGQSLVVWAIQEGREAAKEVAGYVEAPDGTRRLRSDCRDPGC